MAVSDARKSLCPLRRREPVWRALGLGVQWGEAKGGERERRK